MEYEIKEKVHEQQDFVSEYLQGCHGVAILTSLNRTTADLCNKGCYSLGKLPACGTVSHFVRAQVSTWRTGESSGGLNRAVAEPFSDFNMGRKLSYFKIRG